MLVPEGAQAELLEKVYQRTASIGLDAHMRGTFEEAVRQVVAAATETPPAPGTPEDEALLHAVVGLLRAGSALGTEFIEALADLGDEEFEDLLRKEYDTADALRKLVVHQLREAVRSYAGFGRAAAVRLRRADLVGWADLVPDDATDALEELPEEGRKYFRGLAALLVATIRMKEAPDRLDEWAEWAQLASRAARKFEASMHLWFARLDADIPELRSKQAWKDWTEEDVAKEFAPWPGESSP